VARPSHSRAGARAEAALAMVRRRTLSAATESWKKLVGEEPSPATARVPLAGLAPLLPLTLTVRVPLGSLLPVPCTWRFQTVKIRTGATGRLGTLVARN
jgi:hypothetical protein